MNTDQHGFKTRMILVVGLVCASAAFGQRSVVLIDDGWQFYGMPDFRLWPAEPVVTAAQIQQLSCPQPGKAWQPVQLPDDYVVRGEISPQPNASLLAGGAVCPLGGRECEIPNGSPPTGKAGALNRPGRDAYAGHGYLPVYPAWYRRNLAISASAKGKSVWLDFGGVYRDAVIFVNGKFLDQHASGYTGFRLNITAAIRYGEENSVAVFVDPRWFEGWWYEGGGIYRQVRLIIADPLQVAPWGTFVDAQVPGTIRRGLPEGDRAAAQLTVQTTVRNDHPASRNFTLTSEAIDDAGKVIASASNSEELASGQQATFSQQMAMRDARLWSLEHRNLYQLATTLRAGATVVDKELTTFGVRTLRFDPDEGFFLNGRHVEIKGTCTHHDFPGVGTGAPDNLWPWRIQKLIALGANAYRSAHNPSSEAFYDAADRMGMLVMDENRHLGDTYFPKADAGTPYSDLSDVKAMVLQHRNHPSIIMWSMCNEEGQGPTPRGAQMFAAMKEAVKKIDPTRPVTGGINGGYTKEGYISVEDILGMNYHNPEFAKIHGDFPGLMIFGSEDLNSKTSRGTVETSRDAGLVSEYGDPDSSVGSGGEPWQSWVPVTENRFVAGEFVWTGFDYRGEPNPFSWPSVTSQTGIMDLCGFPKPAYYYWKAAWGEKPSVYVFPDWSFPKTMVGKSVLVRCYSNCDRVELRLNGKSLGVREMPRNLYLDWQVPYAPGNLTAIGYNRERVAAQYIMQTAGAPAALSLTPEIRQLAADGEEVAPVRVEVVDAEGRVVPDSEDLVRFSVTGAGALAGVANGNPASSESNVGTERKAFRGLCIVMVRAGNHAGSIEVKAEARGLAPARVVIPTIAVGREIPHP